MASLYELRECELPEVLAAKLAPFIAAWKPHDKPPTRAELLAAGYEKVVTDSFTDEFYELYFETHGYYPCDKPEDNVSDS